MGDIREEYRAWMRQVKGWSDKTVKERVQSYDRMVKMFGSPEAALRAGRDDVLTFLSQAGGSASTRNTYRAHVRSFYSWAVFRGLLPKGSDPTEEVEPVKARAGLPKPLSAGDAMALMEAATRVGGRTRALVCLMLYTGLRLSEAANLRWESVDLTSRRLRVLGKGNKERVLPMNQELVDVLRWWRGEVEGPWVFPSPVAYRGPVHTGTIRVEVDRAARSAGLGHVNPHRLRHTFATTLVDNSVDIRRVQVLLGHSSLATTQVYTQVSVAHLERDIGTLSFG